VLAVDTIMKEFQAGGVHTDQGLESLMKAFTPTIRYHASRLAARLPAYLNAEDLFSVGAMGLLDALDRYDPKLAKFKTFAEHRIRGAMLDEIRAMDWIPRSVRKKMATLQRATESLQQRLGRPAIESEIGAALGLLPEEMSDFLMKAQGASLVSMDEVNDPDEEGRHVRERLPQCEAPDQLNVMVERDNRDLLAAAIEQLPEKERLALRLYYYEEMNMKEAGKVLSVSESRVSQLRRQAVNRLKASLNRDASIADKPPRPSLDRLIVELSLIAP
jgi:RNA polymerase sigma factor for flagellar operon FliA